MIQLFQGDQQKKITAMLQDYIGYTTVNVPFLYPKKETVMDKTALSKLLGSFDGAISLKIILFIRLWQGTVRCFRIAHIFRFDRFQGILYFRRWAVVRYKNTKNNSHAKQRIYSETGHRPLPFLRGPASSHLHWQRVHWWSIPHSETCVSISIITWYLSNDHNVHMVLFPEVSRTTTFLFKWICINRAFEKHS